MGISATDGHKHSYMSKDSINKYTLRTILITETSTHIQSNKQGKIKTILENSGPFFKEKLKKSISQKLKELYLAILF